MQRVGEVSKILEEAGGVAAEFDGCCILDSTRHCHPIYIGVWRMQTCGDLKQQESVSRMYKVCSQEYGRSTEAAGKPEEACDRRTIY